MSKYINFETQRAIIWYVLKQNSKEINVSRELVNCERKTENFREFFEGSQPYFLKTELSQIVCFIN